MKRTFLTLTYLIALPFFTYAADDNASSQEEYFSRDGENETYDYTPQEESRIKTPQEIQQDLEADEALFKQAQEMFNPWYAGPLLTGGAHMMPPGSANIQPYIFVTDTYGVWDSHRKSVHIPRKINLNPSISGFQFGVTDWMDMILSIQGEVSWQKGKRGGGYGDTTLGVGFPLLQEDLKYPAIKFVFNETLPTGKYQRLNPHKIGLDSTGGGSFQSQFGLRISKLYFWSRKHPMNLRAAYSYTIPSRVHVRGLNSYGGSSGTAGVVNPGNYQQANAAMEYSFTQKWVLALDAVYTWSNKTRFRGTRGFTESGELAPVGNGSSDQLSFAPALEYNPSASLNFLAGVWFDVYGRNTSKFVSGIISMSYSFHISK